MKVLNVRETQIIRYTAKGYTAKEIAKIIGLKHRTIEIYISNLRKKLDAKNIANAIYIAGQQNILNDLS
jgi:DNA-binding CsgD family transcriptional regulator